MNRVKLWYQWKVPAGITHVHPQWNEVNRPAMLATFRLMLKDMLQ